MVKSFLQGFLFSFLLMGCSGIVAPTTFEQRVAYVDAGISAVATTTRERVVAGAMTKEDGQKIFQALQQASKGSDMAKGVVKPDGKICSDELSCLKFAQEQLLKLEAQLKASEKK